jgi:hypothetical protein
MRRWWTFAFAAMLGCASSEDADGEETRARQCSRLRDHLIELRLAGTDANVEAHRTAMREALGDAFIDQCSTQLTTRQLDCALGAKDRAQALECTHAAR